MQDHSCKYGIILVKMIPYLNNDTVNDTEKGNVYEDI